PDASHCGFAENPSAATLSQRITIYETEEWQLIGHRIENFWRPGKVPVRVGEKVTNDIHLLQLWHRFEERAEEILVLYPPDGYWRARPLPPAHMPLGAYGSSFLVRAGERGRAAGRPRGPLAPQSQRPRFSVLGFQRDGAVMRWADVRRTERGHLAEWEQRCNNAAGQSEKITDAHCRN